MALCFRPLGLDVLVERAAEGHVQQLAAAAHADHRLALQKHGMQQCELVAVAHRVAGPARVHGRLAIGLRRHVGAALQHQAVEFAHELGHREMARDMMAVLGDRRHHEGERAMLHDPVGEGLLEVLQGLVAKAHLGRHLVQQPCRDAYLQGPGIALWGLGVRSHALIVHAFPLHQIPTDPRKCFIRSIERIVMVSTFDPRPISSTMSRSGSGPSHSFL